jgi:hypothetical protein
MAVRSSALCINCLYTQEDSWYSFLLEADFPQGPIARLEGLLSFVLSRVWSDIDLNEISDRIYWTLC